MFPKDTKIIIVDDMMTMRKLVRKTLLDLGYSVVTEASDGDKAWPEIQNAAAAKTPFQLIISDWNMPNLTGIELLKRVCTTENLKNTPFILLSAEGEKEKVSMAMEAGVNGYITKPFTGEAFSSKLAAVWTQTK
ncbi:MAG: response regulator [Bdellovibrionota bacterium]